MFCSAKSCCIFFPLRQGLIVLGLGSLVIGFLGAGISLVNLISEMDDVSQIFEDSPYCDEGCVSRMITMSIYIMSSQAISFSLLCLCALALLAGVLVFTDVPSLLVPYLVYLPLDILLQLVDIILFTVILYTLRVTATRIFWLFAYWFLASVLKLHFFAAVKSYHKRVTGSTNGQVYPDDNQSQVTHVELQDSEGALTPSDYTYQHTANSVPLPPVHSSVPPSVP